MKTLKMEYGVPVKVQFEADRTINGDYRNHHPSYAWAEDFGIPTDFGVAEVCWAKRVFGVELHADERKVNGHCLHGDWLKAGHSGWLLQPERPQVVVALIKAKTREGYQPAGSLEEQLWVGLIEKDSDEGGKSMHGDPCPSVRIRWIEHFKNYNMNRAPRIGAIARMLAGQIERAYPELAGRLTPTPAPRFPVWDLLPSGQATILDGIEEEEAEECPKSLASIKPGLSARSADALLIFELNS